MDPVPHGLGCLTASDGVQGACSLRFPLGDGRGLTIFTSRRETTVFSFLGTKAKGHAGWHADIRGLSQVLKIRRESFRLTNCAATPLLLSCRFCWKLRKRPTWVSLRLVSLPSHREMKSRRSTSTSHHHSPIFHNSSALRCFTVLRRLLVLIQLLCNGPHKAD